MTATIHQLRSSGATSTQYVVPTPTSQRGYTTRSPLLQDEYSVESLPPTAAWAAFAEVFIAAEASRHRKATALVAALFADCLSKWSADTQYTSSATDLVLHPSYQRIIGLGPDVLPFIFRELEKDGAHWYSALTSLTGANPVPSEDRGRVKKMKEAWLAWAACNGYMDA